MMMGVLLRMPATRLAPAVFAHRGGHGLRACASTPLGQDLSESFALYAAPCDLGPLPLGAEPDALGILKPRGDVHRDGDWHRSVHVWLADCDGRLLLQKRSEFKDTNPGLLDVSCAGHITGNDPVLETAVRELEEELGLTMTMERMRASRVCTLPGTQTGSTATHGSFLCNEFQDIFVVQLESTLDVSTLQLGTDEVAGVEWRAADEVIQAWAAADAAFVPRTEAYCAILSRALASG